MNKKPYSYRFELRKKSVIKAVCEVSGLTLREMTVDFHDDADSIFRKTVRNILADMLIKNAELPMREVGGIVCVSLGQVSNIVNRNKTLMENNIRKECFEKYCQLMFNGINVCEFPDYRRVHKYKNRELHSYDVIEVLPILTM